ncbi:SDR family oxidoreductase (plasmid) [Sphingobium sp. JS3065]|nr:SDR family oxidoreductase [Sphingobium sp. JS3065]
MTGGGSGIGLAAARAAAMGGMTVALLDTDESAGAAAVAALTQDGFDARAYAIDVTDEDAVRSVAERIESELGAVAGLVTSAGTSRPGPAVELSLADWRTVIDVNLTGTFICCQAFGRAMLARQRGSIVTISSIAGVSAVPSRVNYTASKWGVVGMTKALAANWSMNGVRVNCVAPGMVDTPILQKAQLSPEYWEDVFLARTPLGRPARPDEIGSIIAFLLSEASSYMTGSVLVADGGITLGFDAQRPKRATS